MRTAARCRLIGGAGNDIFVFDHLTDSVMDTYRADGSKSLPDVTLDFAPGEGKIGELRVEARDGYVHVYADVDGDGLADMQIIVATPTIQASDFFL